MALSYTQRIYSSQIILENLKNNLNKSFGGAGYYQPTIFSEIDKQALGFREAIVVFGYMPVMHGKIELTHSTVKVSCFANWFPIVLSLLLCYGVSYFRIDLRPIYILSIAGGYGLDYLIQLKRVKKIVSHLMQI